MWQFRQLRNYLPRIDSLVLFLCVAFLGGLVWHFRTPPHLSNLSRLNPSIVAPGSSPSSFASDHDTPYPEPAPSPISAPSDPSEAPKYQPSSGHHNNKQEAPPPARLVVVKLEPSGDIKHYGIIQTLDSAAISPTFTTISYKQFIFWNTWCHAAHPVISNDPMQCWSIWIKVYLETKDFHGTDCKKEKNLHIMAQESMVKLWSYPHFESLDTYIKTKELPEFHKSIGKCLEHHDQGFKHYAINITEKPRWFFNQLINFYILGSPWMILGVLFMLFFYHWVRDMMMSELQERYYRDHFCYVCGQGWNGRYVASPSWTPSPVTYPTYNR